MARGGGAMWITGTYDPDLNLLYWGSGNPHPVLAGIGRLGDNLYTSCILAINPDTGAIVWSFQASPHDTHDWDAVETPVLFDADFNGKPRKLVAQASRNGYFFVLDRQTGENLLTSPFVKINFAKGIDAKGSPIPDPAKEPQPDGALVQGACLRRHQLDVPQLRPADKTLLRQRPGRLRLLVPRPRRRRPPRRSSGRRLRLPQSRRRSS